MARKAIIVGGLRAPDGFRLELDRVGEEEWRMLYAEKFPNKQLIRRSAEKLEAANLDERLAITFDDEYVIIEGTIQLSEAADMMVSEFVPWSNIGSKTLGELFAFMTRLAVLGRDKA